MAVTAALVKELRDRTGAGMMECKKALVETDGDIDSAIENLRKAGAAKADKKASRVAAEGRVVYKLADDGKSAALVEVNCETDFVAGDDNFTDFSAKVCQRVLEEDPQSIDALGSISISADDSTSINDVRETMIGKIGENIQVRRFNRLQTENSFGVYQHGTRICVIVDFKGGDEQLGKDLAMHIAATAPVCVSAEQLPAELVAKEKSIFLAQAKESGKPDDIAEKMVVGKLNKFMAENTLVGQPFVKDPDQKISALLKAKNAEVLSFLRLEVGEGIEKKSENFAEEVMAQIQE